MRNAVRAGNYIRPEELQGLQTTGLSAERASLFYAEAISLVNFLIDTYGSERFLILTDHLRDGYPFLRGLGAATYGQLDTLEKLHVAWVRYLTGSDPVASSPPVADLPRPGTSTQGAGKGLVFKQNSVGDGTALNIDSNGAGSPAPDFTLEEFLSGRQVSLSDYIGRKVILLDFWATWCDLCKEQVPMLVKLQNEWKGYGVQVLAVALSPGDPGDRKKIQRLADRYGINYPVLLDTDYKVAQELYKLKGAIPLALFIDCKGSLFYEYVGNDQNAIEVFSGVLETCTRDPACSM
jgi:peroxiredoxin